MSTLLLDRAQLEVRTDGDALALYEAGVRRGSVPIKLLERCIIQGAQTRLESGVLLKLAEAGVTTVLFSPRLGRRVATVLGPAHNDASVRLAQAQRVGDPVWCLHWAEQLVRTKLLRQRKSLRTWLAARPDARKPLTDAIASVDATLVALSAAPSRVIDQRPAVPAVHAAPSTRSAFQRADGYGPDASTSSASPQAGAMAPRSLVPCPGGPSLSGATQAALASLRGLEGAAARAHFAGLAAVLPPVLGFTGRNRRPPRDPANACLSLAYTLLHVEAVQACHLAGLDPLLGFYHRPAFGRESLASDLIEPLRGAADLWVWQQFRERTLREDHFKDDKGACLLGKAGRSAFYACWERDAKPLRRCLRRSAASLARALRQEGLAWLEQQDPDEEEAC